MEWPVLWMEKTTDVIYLPFRKALLCSPRYAHKQARKKKSWVIYVRCVEVQEIVYQCFRVNTPDLIEKLRSLSLDKAQNVHQWHVTVPSSSGWFADDLANDWPALNGWTLGRINSISSELIALQSWRENSYFRDENRGESRLFMSWIVTPKDKLKS